MGAAQKAFVAVGEDAGFQQASYLLVDLALAGNKADAAKQLAELGVRIQAHPSLAEVAMQISREMDRRIDATRKRTDFGEMAQVALVGALVEHVQEHLPVKLMLLPQMTPSRVDVMMAFKELSKERIFGAVARRFPAPVVADPSSGTIPVGYLSWNVTDGAVKRHAGSYSWEIKVGSGTSAKVGFHGPTPTVHRANANQAEATDLASVITLANELRPALVEKASSRVRRRTGGGHRFPSVFLAPRHRRGAAEAHRWRCSSILADRSLLAPLGAKQRQETRVLPKGRELRGVSGLKKFHTCSTELQAIARNCRGLPQT